MSIKRSIIYIDGFNLYYGALKNTPWKWLNIERYFKLLRPHDDIQIIKYFSAILWDNEKGKQQIYLNALSTLQRVEIILGKFKNKKIKCLVPDCTYSGSKRFWVPEEKRTDVNIALHILNDALKKACDRFIIVSGDSDLCPAINMIKSCAPNCEVIVYVPARNLIRGAAVEIRNLADKHKTLPNNLLSKSQFPVKIPDGYGGFITKPSSW